MKTIYAVFSHAIEQGDRMTFISCIKKEEISKIPPYIGDSEMLIGECDIPPGFGERPKERTWIISGIDPCGMIVECDVFPVFIQA